MTNVMVISKTPFEYQDGTATTETWKQPVWMIWAWGGAWIKDWAAHHMLWKCAKNVKSTPQGEVR